VRNAFMIAALGAAVLGTGAAAIAALPPPGLPAGVQQVSPCIPGMGEHWANPKNLPFGPIYGVYDGKVVFTEVMIDQKAFAAGKSWTDQLKPIAGHPIDHIDIEFQAKGHPGYTIPHYDIHAYFVPHAVHSAYCPQGSH
jgi:hypothetical protein